VADQFFCTLKQLCSLSGPEAALTRVTPPEVSDVIVVVYMPSEIADPPAKMLASLEMASRMAVALVLGGIE